MKVPLETNYKDVKQSNEVSAYIKNRVNKLEQFSERIIKCRVLIEKVSQNNQPMFNTRITLSIPQFELTTHNNVTENMYKSIHNAFNRIQRQLEDHHHTMEGFVKHHDAPSIGTVRRLFNHDEFGFIECLDGSEYYFNSDNMIHHDFNKLQVGDDVQFIQAMGSDGAQAHHIKLAKRKRHR